MVKNFKPGGAAALLQRQLDAHPQAAQRAVPETQAATAGLGDVARDAQAQAMAADLLVEPGTPLEHRLALVGEDTGAVIVDLQADHALALRDGQADFAIGPLAGVVQQIAEHLQQVLAVPWQAQPRWRAPAHPQVRAVDQAQGVAQRRQLLGAIEMCARQRFADQAALPNSRPRRCWICSSCSRRTCCNSGWRAISPRSARLTSTASGVFRA